jgi:hypothetical protein
MLKCNQFFFREEIMMYHQISSHDVRRPFGFGRRPFGRPFGYGFGYGFGGPFIGGVLGGVLGSALIGRPYYYGYPPYPYPYYPYY